MRINLLLGFGAFLAMGCSEPKKEPVPPPVTVIESPTVAAEADETLYQGSVELTRYAGTYLPQLYLTTLATSHSHNVAMARLGNLSAFLRVTADHVWGNLSYDDGFAKKASEIDRFTFQDGGLVDESGNAHVKVFARNDDSIYPDLIASIAKQQFTALRYHDGASTLEVTPSGDLVLNGEVWKLSLNHWAAPDDVDVYRSGEKSLGVKSEGDSATVYALKGEPGAPQFDDSREVLFRFAKD